MQRRSYKHVCEHQNGEIRCDKRTKAMFCEEHIPVCKKCGKKCRKFDDLENVYCFRHSEYRREKTREYVARSRDRKHERNSAQLEIMKAAWENAFEGTRDEYLTHLGVDYLRMGEDEFEAFKLWLGEKYPLKKIKYDIGNNACTVMEGLSGDQLQDYKREILEELMMVDVDDFVDNLDPEEIADLV